MIILSRQCCQRVRACVALYWLTNRAASLGRNDRSSMPGERLTSCSPKCANVWRRCSELSEPQYPPVSGNSRSLGPNNNPTLLTRAIVYGVFIALNQSERGGEERRYLVRLSPAGHRRSSLCRPCSPGTCSGWKPTGSIRSSTRRRTERAVLQPQRKIDQSAGV